MTITSKKKSLLFRKMCYVVKFHTENYSVINFLRVQKSDATTNELQMLRQVKKKIHFDIVVVTIP